MMGLINMSSGKNAKLFKFGLFDVIIVIFVIIVIVAHTEKTSE